MIFDQHDIDTEEEDHHPYETREAKNVESDEGEARGLLDTLNLSLAGNLDISNAVGQVSSDGLLSLLSNPGREITWDKLTAITGRILRSEIVFYRAQIN